MVWKVVFVLINGWAYPHVSYLQHKDVPQTIFSGHNVMTSPSVRGLACSNVMESISCSSFKGSHGKTDTSLAM